RQKLEQFLNLFPFLIISQEVRQCLFREISNVFLRQPIINSIPVGEKKAFDGGESQAEKFELRFNRIDRETVSTVLFSNLGDNFIQGIPPGYMSFGKRQDVPCQRMILFVF